MTQAAFKSGMVSVIGRPNVGKSTLVNILVGQKISITSQKVQTTRHRIHGIKTSNSMQMVLVDTPGIHSGTHKKALNRQLNRTAKTALDGIDCILLLVEVMRWTQDEDTIVKLLQGISIPLVVVINKIDLLSAKEMALPFFQKIEQHLPENIAIVPISALRNDGLNHLEAVIEKVLPVGDLIFPEDYVTDKSVRFLVAEIVREKLTWRLNQEIPYGIAVDVERFEEGKTLTKIDAVIYVERKVHKAIVVGKQGELLKWVGTQARIDIEKLINTKLYLKLWVKVRSNWSDDEAAIHALGYE